MDVDVDNILTTLGPWKRYQIFQLIYTGLIHMFGTAYVVLLYVFIGYSPAHRCSNLNQSLHSYGIPSHINDSMVKVEYGQCEINVYSNMTSEKWTLACVNGYTYDTVSDTIVSEWNLVCTRAGLGELVQTLVAAGQCVGAILFASMADRFGRKPILVWSHVALFVIAVGTFFVPSYTIFAITRLLLGSMNQGVAIVLSTLLLELFPKECRGTVGALLSVFWTIAVMSLTAFGYGLRNYSWRYVQLAVGLTSVHSLFGYWLIDESLRWLIANKRTDEAIKVIKKIAKINKINVNKVLSIINLQLQNQDALLTTQSTREPFTNETNFELEEVDEAEEMEENIDTIETTTDSLPSVAQQYTLLDIIRSGILLRNSFILWFAWCINSLTYYGLFLTSSSMSGSRFLNYFINGAVELPSNVIFWIMINKTSRKTIVVFFHLLAGVSLIISVALLTVNDDSGKTAIVSTVFSFLGKLGISSSFNAVWLYTPELYPTNLRSAGMGVASTMARVGGMIAPFSALLAAKVIWGPGVVFGGCCILVTVLVTVLPETGSRELPNTLEELVNWTKDQSGWNFSRFKRTKIEEKK